jgi:hypothetical protein
MYPPADATAEAPIPAADVVADWVRSIAWAKSADMLFSVGGIVSGCAAFLNMAR